MASSLPRTLPASWYCSPALYRLEQRAIFQKSWYLLGSVTKFTDEHAVDYEFADVKLSVTREAGNQSDEAISVSFADGTQAPSHITASGLLFAAASLQVPPFTEFFPGLEETLGKVDFRIRPFRRSIQYEGHFNWKAMVDGYQECLHCQYTHPAFSELYPPTSYSVVNHHNWCQHFADPKKPNDGLFLYFFPVCTLNVYGGGMSLFRVCPLASRSDGLTRMEFDYYHMESGEKFEEYYKFVRQVALEDYELCEKAQYNLERAVYSEGILNPVKEIGVIYYQQRVLEMVLSQHHADKNGAPAITHSIPA